MVHKLKHLGANKQKIALRVYLSDVISKIENFVYNDNPNIQNRFHEPDHRIRKNAAKQLKSFYRSQRGKKRKTGEDANQQEDPLCSEKIDQSETFQNRQWNQTTTSSTHKLPPRDVKKPKWKGQEPKSELTKGHAEKIEGTGTKTKTPKL